MSVPFGTVYYDSGNYERFNCYYRRLFENKLQFLHHQNTEILQFNSQWVVTGRACMSGGGSAHWTSVVDWSGIVEARPLVDVNPPHPIRVQLSVHWYC